MDQQQQQVAEAANAMVSPTADMATRTAASQFLEAWTQTESAWVVYAAWIRSFSNNLTAGNGSEGPIAELVGMQLLCLQLLQAKIRREVHRGTEHSANPAVVAVQSELAFFLQTCNRHGHQNQPQRQHSPLPESVISSACICLAALSVRCGNVSDLIQTCRSFCCQKDSVDASNRTNLSPYTSLKILSNVPTEVEQCSDLTTPQVTELLFPYLEMIIDTVRVAVASNAVTTDCEQIKQESMQVALEALKNWTKTCHATLTHLNSPTCGGNSSLLPLLVEILSSSSSYVTSQAILVEASEALTEAIMAPADSCTETRSVATQLLFQATTAGFVVLPMQQATENEWEDACHALATLICTAVTEEIDNLVNQPSETVIHLLLQIQSHPLNNVRLTALECWLTVQEIPVSQRHDNWKAPLFSRVVEGLLITMAYPRHFRDWDSELLDQSEFEEFRRMAGDVLIAAYYLLRADFVSSMSHRIVTSQDWTIQEVALYSLTVTAREVCARVKARCGGSSQVKDKNRTVEELLRLIQQLMCGCGTHDASRAVTLAASGHILVLSGITKFIGAYASTWSTKCSAETVLQLLAYLRAVLVASSTPSAVPQLELAVEAAKSTRSVLISCSNLLLSPPPQSPPSCLAVMRQALMDLVGDIMESTLLLNHEEAMTTVTEGCIRLLVQIKDDQSLRQSLTKLVHPVFQRGEDAIKLIPSDGSALSEQAFLAVESLGKLMHVLQTIIRFSDTSEDASNPISEIMPSLWPFLNKASQKTARYEVVLSRILAVHEQLLKTIPKLVEPHFDQTVTYVVNVFETTKHVSTLSYMSSAVEVFGSLNIEAFRNLLAHISEVMLNYVSTEKRPNECPELIAVYYELNQRYIIYCPAALVSCPKFSFIVACAVECLTACQGERESTRATLNFLSQLFGWRYLRLAPEKYGVLQAASQLLDEKLLYHGAPVTHSCLMTLLGGPQMLWPACTDCLFAVNAASVTWPAPEDSAKSVAEQWMEMARPSTNAGLDNKNAQNTGEAYQKMVILFLSLVREGSKNKAKAKMLLTDYCKIHRGEESTDVLIAYQIS